ncbi:MAG: hypothetical protein HRU20_20535 [Pseudomonadales bacterium]|nr:hypothetical protein [Pseudomonadales bacterium]
MKLSWQTSMWCLKKLVKYSLLALFIYLVVGSLWKAATEDERKQAYQDSLVDVKFERKTEANGQTYVVTHYSQGVVKVPIEYIASKRIGRNYAVVWMNIYWPLKAPFRDNLVKGNDTPLVNFRFMIEGRNGRGNSGNLYQSILEKHRKGEITMLAESKLDHITVYEKNSKPIYFIIDDGHANDFLNQPGAYHCADHRNYNFNCNFSWFINDRLYVTVKFNDFEVDNTIAMINTISKLVERFTHGRDYDVNSAK